MRTTRARGRGAIRLELVLALGVLDFSLEQAIVVPALPVVQATFHTSAEGTVWMITAFLLAAAVATPVAGRLGDRHGRRRVLSWSLAAFVVGSLMCALADSIDLMIAGRVVQGLGAGVGPLAAALVREHVPPAQIPRAIGLIVGAGGAGGVIGLLGGALLVDRVSVQSVFWLLGVTALLLLVAVRVAVPASEGRDAVPVDWIGAALLSGSLVAVSLALSQGNAWGWGSAPMVGLFAGFALLLSGFVVRERTAAAPLLDPSGLARRPMWSAQLAVFVVGLALSAAYALVPFVAALPESTGHGLGLDPTETGLVLAPSAVAALLGGLAGGRLVSRIGPRTLVLAGLLCVATTYALFVLAQESALLVAGAMLPLGFGVGCSIGAIVNLVVLCTDEAETGAVMGLNSVIRAVGSGLGAAAAIAIVAGSGTIAPGVPHESGFTAAFAAGLAAALVAAAVAATIPRRSIDPTIGVARDTATPRPAPPRSSMRPRARSRRRSESATRAP